MMKTLEKPQKGPNALATHAGADALMQIISRISTDSSMDVAKLKELLDVKERWEKDEARKAFVAALSDFKAEPLDIFKNKEVDFRTDRGRVNYKHATLDNVSNAIGAALSKHGLSHRWDVEQKDGKIRVTCILMHSAGHSEKVSLEAAADQSGSKNAIQAIGSTVTYLERYTLLASTGTAVQDQDHDGKEKEDEKKPELTPAAKPTASAPAAAAQSSEGAKKNEKAEADPPKGYLIDKVTKSAHPGLFYIFINGVRYSCTDEEVAKGAYDLCERNKKEEPKRRIEFASETKDKTQFLLSYTVVVEIMPK